MQNYLVNCGLPGRFSFGLVFVPLAAFYSTIYTGKSLSITSLFGKFSTG